MSLIIVGSMAIDSVKTPFGKVDNVLGGSTCYASIAASNFTNVGIVGVIGNDFPAEHLEMLQKHNVDLTGVEQVQGKTFRWIGEYNDLNKAETLDTQLNVFADFDPKIPEKYRKAKYLFLGNIDPELQLKVLEQMEAPEIVACDTMNFWITSKKKSLMEVIRKVNILFINEDEIKMLTNEENIYKSANFIFEQGVEYIVLKRGEYGSIVMQKNNLFFSPIFPVKKVIDPTGAGDSFAGGFMGFLAEKNKMNLSNLKQAMIYGTITASFCIESFSLDSLKKVDLQKIENRKKLIKEMVFFD